ncbi:MAG: molybdate ABC transporter substrate-binding protein [Desulfobacteraceae bacterium]|nr:MAG: molybdate ABC transporter substrate-binding protein [Desulfobacteraceae bacterium]
MKTVALFFCICLFILHGVEVRKVQAAEELIVSAAASLTNVMNAVKDDFQFFNPSIRVIFNFASSGSLVQQIRHGAPVDIFVSANQFFMDRLSDEGLILSNSRIDFTSNQIVLIVPLHSRCPLAGLENLQLPGFQRIAIGHPETVPAGRYAKASLLNAGLWDALKDKFIYANSVRQVLAYTIREEVDAGFVYASDIMAANGRVREVVMLKNIDPILYPVAIIASSGHLDAASGFIRFLHGETGQRILDQYGFIRLQGEKP